MTRIPEEMIETIRTKTDIVDLIGEYVQLTKRGKNWFGLCPFHGESTPSFSVSEEKQLFHCFGCGASGNAITFIMDIENSPFTEAVVKLADRTGVEIDIGPATSEGSYASKQSDEHRRMMEAHTLATSFYSHLLLNTVEGEAALQYLEKRGFSREYIEKYGIGWALDNREALSELLKRKSFDMKEMERAGLCIMKDDGTGYFDRFRGRIMFPLRDDNGNVVAFSGRTLSKDKQVAKYLNSPETPIFEKSRLLYNFHNARLNVRKTGKVIVFEGFMDTLSADRIGVSNSVAVMGTALSDSHIVKLKRIAKDVLICCDGDDAGWTAAKRFADSLLAKGMNVEIALLPSNFDPDDYISQHGGQAFIEKVIGNPNSYMSFIMAFAKRSKNLTFENDMLQYIHEVLSELVNRQSPVERDLYMRQLSVETGVSMEALGQQFLKLNGKQASLSKKMNQDIEKQESPANGKSKTATDRAERLLLCHLMNDGALFDRIRDEFPELFIKDVYQAVFIRLAGFYEQFGAPDYHRFAESLEDRDLRKIVLDAAMVERDPDHKEEEVEDCIQHLVQQRIRLSIQDKLNESKTAEKLKDHTRALELAREIIQLRKSLSAL
ncbi:DNA primase [Sporosarcina sp. 179-K 3D1 HS]|uniref:DNA primase n=1 Tax=Sporosarcina sp. 179-K 3D1 HS TaxID=3232169 RepID=UPI00399F9D9C